MRKDLKVAAVVFGQIVGCPMLRREMLMETVEKVTATPLLAQTFLVEELLSLFGPASSRTLYQASKGACALHISKFGWPFIPNFFLNRYPG